MAYMSDIDLATLHKTRLEEKMNYRLSWLTSYKSRATVASIFGDAPVVKSKAYNCHSASVPKKGAATASKAGSKKVPAAAGVGKVKRAEDDCDTQFLAKEIEARARRDFDQISDDGYFSSDAQQRRRSGTWP